MTIPKDLPCWDEFFYLNNESRRRTRDEGKKCSFGDTFEVFWTDRNGHYLCQNHYQLIGGS